MANEVTSPDQRKPEPVKIWRAVWLLIAALVLVMFLGNHTGRVEDVWLAVVGGGIILGVILDALMRKRGWK